MAELHKTAYQYRLHLTRGQQRLLEQQLEECRWVYSQTLAARRDVWEHRQETLGLYDTQALLPDWKAERRSLKLVHSLVLQNVQLRVDLAFKAFFRRVKAAESEAGYPRFKGFGRYDSMTYPQYGNGARLEGNRLILSKIGAVLINLHRGVEGRIKTVTLRRSSTGKWFVAFAVERERTAVADIPQAGVGVDVGLEKFATLSTGETIANPRFFRGDERDLKRAQRRLSEQQKGTSERARRRRSVARIHERIASRRKNFAHQQSRKLVNRFGIIVFEDLSITRMSKNHCLAKSIADAAWGHSPTIRATKRKMLVGRISRLIHLLEQKAGALPSVTFTGNQRLFFRVSPSPRIARPIVHWLIAVAWAAGERAACSARVASGKASTWARSSWCWSAVIVGSKPPVGF
jgi:putative transposase